MNQLTRALQINSDLFIRVDEKFKEMGEYGMVKATPKEQREQFNRLSFQDVFGKGGLIEKHGVVEVQKYFKQMRGMK